MVDAAEDLPLRTPKRGGGANGWEQGSMAHK